MNSLVTSPFAHATLLYAFVFLHSKLYRIVLLATSFSATALRFLIPLVFTLFFRVPFASRIINSIVYDTMKSIIEIEIYLALSEGEEVEDTRGRIFAHVRRILAMTRC